MNLLVFVQGYPPDPMAVGQHIGDVAEEMVRRGHRVTVLTARHGYDDPTITYPPHEVRRGVEVVRLPLSSVGKRSLSQRVMAAASYQVQCTLAGLTRRGVDAILSSTVPPLGTVAALPSLALRGIPFAYWVMDLNPDQLITVGKMRETSPLARVLEQANRTLLRRAGLVVALDRFMEQRLRAKVDLDGRLAVVPPWAHGDAFEPLPHDQNPFRKEHGLEGKFVFMYSGNHSMLNPLDTLLEATLAFRDDPDVVFLFIGGGQGKQQVNEHIARHGLSQVRSLPYQPLDQLRFSLSAADVHLATMGDPFVGVTHPCKIYGAMAVARPILFVGPQPSHVTDLLDAHRFGWRIAHDDVEGALRTMRAARATPEAERAAMGARGRAALLGGLSQAHQCGRVCDGIEAMVSGARRPPRSDR